MNGESDQPPAALTGAWAEDEDEPEAPPLQLPRNSGNARETRQLPNARILEWGPSASNDMTFLPETYRTQATRSASPERKVDPAPFGSRTVPHKGPRATMTRVLALAREAYNTPLKGGDHEKNTRGIALFRVRRRLGPDRRRPAQRREEHRKPHHLRHGLRPEDVQPAQGNQQVQRQAPGSDLELQPDKRHGRALAAYDLLRCHGCGQRQLDISHRRRDRQADLAHARPVRARGAARRDQRRAYARTRDDLPGQALSPDGGRARARARHEDRQGDLEAEVRRMERRLQGRYRADHRQRRAGVGNGRRGQHHAPLRRGLRSGYRGAGVAQRVDTRARRSGLRNLAEPNLTPRLGVTRRGQPANGIRGSATL